MEDRAMQTAYEENVWTRQVGKGRHMPDAALAVIHIDQVLADNIELLQAVGVLWICDVPHMLQHHLLTHGRAHVRTIPIGMFAWRQLEGLNVTSTVICI